jgi:hypothetical protein
VDQLRNTYGSGKALVEGVEAISHPSTIGACRGEAGGWVYAVLIELTGQEDVETVLVIPADVMSRA